MPGSGLQVVQNTSLWGVLIQTERQTGVILIQGRSSPGQSQQRVGCVVWQWARGCAPINVTQPGCAMPRGWKGRCGVRAGLGPPWLRALETDLSSDQTSGKGQLLQAITWASCWQQDTAKLVEKTATQMSWGVQSQCLAPSESLGTLLWPSSGRV